MIPHAKIINSFMAQQALLNKAKEKTRSRERCADHFLSFASMLRTIATATNIAPHGIQSSHAFEQHSHKRPVKDPSRHNQSVAAAEGVPRIVPRWGTVQCSDR
eukprot:GHVU01127543.1.p1 GENE.GHVU01127543.1~~GHVU01127543.1.p1  ORF type:complete len:103 (-),score=2.67 GHVU01127543.1:23-331(-)